MSKLIIICGHKTLGPKSTGKSISINRVRAYFGDVIRVITDWDGTKESLSEKYPESNWPGAGIILLFTHLNKDELAKSIGDLHDVDRRVQSVFSVDELERNLECHGIPDDVSGDVSDQFKVNKETMLRIPRHDKLPEFVRLTDIRGKGAVLVMQHYLLTKIETTIDRAEGIKLAALLLSHFDVTRGELQRAAENETPTSSVK